jgi:hypothetical protein
MKNKLIEDAREARHARFKSLRTEKVVRGRKVYEKSAAERKQEDVDEERVDREVKRVTFEKAKKAFYGGDIARNPWNAAYVLDVGFWRRHEGGEMVGSV